MHMRKRVSDKSERASKHFNGEDLENWSMFIEQLKRKKDWENEIKIRKVKGELQPAPAVQSIEQSVMQFAI